MNWRLRIPSSQLDHLLALLEDPSSLGGISEHEEEAWLFFPSEELARAAAALVGGACEHLPDQNWCANWQESWQPSPLGQRWFLQPDEAASSPHPPSPDSAGRLVLRMRRGNVFGGGDHPTTQACLLLLETLWSLHHPLPQRSLDIGSGTGILSQAVALLGLPHRFACDIEWDSALCSHTFARSWQGSLSAASGSFDLLLANLSPGTLEELAPAMRTLSAPGAAWIWSGYLPEQQARIEAAAGLSPAHQLTRQGWAASLFLLP